MNDEYNDDNNYGEEDDELDDSDGEVNSYNDKFDFAYFSGRDLVEFADESKLIPFKAYSCATHQSCCITAKDPLHEHRFTWLQFISILDNSTETPVEYILICRFNTTKEAYEFRLEPVSVGYYDLLIDLVEKQTPDGAVNGLISLANKYF